MIKNNLHIDDNHISAEIIKKYFKNKLSVSEKQRVDDLIEHNEFYKDAFEGYKTNPQSINDLSELKQTGFKKFSIQSKLYFYILVPAFLIIIVSAIIFSLNNKTKSDQITNESNMDKEISFSEAEIVKEIKQLSEADPIPYEEQIHYYKTLNNQPMTFEKIDKTESENLQKIVSKEAKELNEGNNELLEAISVRYTTSNHTISYIYDLKVVKYTSNRKNMLNRNIYNLGSLEVEYSNFEDKNNYIKDHSDMQIPYTDFLEQAISKYIDQDYGSALIDFHIILNQFPDDLNAFFYGGLCYYNLGKFDKALKYLEKAAKHPVNTFDQEAEWYMALTYLKIPDINKAKDLFLSIIEKGGFYTINATKEYEKLK
ncbi:MAG: tetratricopeptide repeat protein [Bacteroidota bacterium]